jgi:hypothetical protein
MGFPKGRKRILSLGRCLRFHIANSEINQQIKTPWAYARGVFIWQFAQYHLLMLPLQPAHLRDIQTLQG